MRSQLSVDLSCNRMQLRESHSRLIREVAALMEHEEIRGVQVSSPAWQAVLHLRSTYDTARTVEKRALDLLERATDRLEEGEKQ